MALGKFITFEGGEGAGKSTQARQLAQRLQRLRIPSILTREPGGTELAEAIRALLLNPAYVNRSSLSEVLLFYAARADHIATVIRPALQAGKWVICDRFSDSTRAYQGAAQRLNRLTIEALDQIVVGTYKPDLTILLDLEPSIGLRRAIRRTYGAINSQSRLHHPEQLAFSFAPDRFEALDSDFHRAVREGFLQIARDELHRFIVVDGNEGIIRIADKIWEKISDKFGLDTSVLVASNI